MSSFCNPDDIKVSPDRWRIPAIDDPAVVEMADSIKEIGQLQTVLVSDDMELRDGLHRLLACKRLGRQVWFSTEAEGKLILNNPLLVRVAEYQANFRRKDWTPAEKNKAIAEMDRLMREVYGSRVAAPGATGGWTQTDTAKKLGLKNHRPVSEAIAITKAIEKGVPGVAEAKTTQEAFNIVKKTIKLEAAEVLAKRQSEKGTAEIADPMAFFGKRIIQGDCRMKMKGLMDGICNLFITDPPFAVNLDQILKNRQDGEKGLVTACDVYEDSPDNILPMLREVILEMGRIGKPDCQAIMFCVNRYWETLCGYFQEAGFTTYKRPLIWVKASKEPFRLMTGRTNNPAISFGSSYEPMVYAWRGNAVIAKQGLSDVFIHPTIPGGEKCHVAQKPISLLEEVISRFYHPGTNPLLIDPFAGSGTTLIAARRVGVKQYLGYELSQQNRERALAYIVNQYMLDKIEPVETKLDTVDIEEDFA